MNWIFEIYGDTYKALITQGGRRKPSPAKEQAAPKPSRAFTPNFVISPE
jgi:hypothetical protein